jgi:hypothetical protein
MPVEVEMEVERLPRRFQQRRRLREKRDADVVRTGRRFEARLQVYIDGLATEPCVTSGRMRKVSSLGARGAFPTASLLIACAVDS